MKKVNTQDKSINFSSDPCEHDHTIQFYDNLGILVCQCLNCGKRVI